MKKLLYLLFALPLFAMVACDDDKEADVNVNVKFDKATVVDGTAYLVKGDTLGVDSLWVVPVDTKHTAAIVGNGVTYSINGRPVARGFYPKFDAKFPTDSLAVGDYVLNAVFNVAETDCPISICATNIDFKIVNTQADIPTGGVPAGVVTVK